MSGAQIKLAIREDKASGVIVAYISDMEETEMNPIAAFSVEIARKDRKIFDAWVLGMQGVMTAICESAIGIKPTGYFRFNLGDKQ